MTSEVALRPSETNLGALQYFKLLLKKAGNGADIRMQVIRLTEKLAMRMTFGASSSIRAEAAQGLIESAMYCIGYRLKSVCEQEAIRTLCSAPAEIIWREGRDMIKRRSETERKTLVALKSAFFTQSRAYNDTIDEGLPDFFKWYDADFAAHESPGMIDYFLCREVTGLSGIEYVSEYLRRLSIESALCGRFGEHPDVLLSCLGGDWRETHVNIYELVLANAAARTLCGKDLSSLCVSGADREKLQKSLGGMSKRRLNFVLSASAERVCTLAGVTDAAARGYARAAMRGIASRVINALKTGSLEAVFMRYKAERPKTQFISGAKMDDETFRAVADEICGCRHVSDKLAIIKKHVNNIDDLADLLGASCLYGDEFETLFETLDEMALALLWQRAEGDDLHVSEAESEWHRALTVFVKAHGDAVRIKTLSQSIEQR